ncbi:MAG: transposase, partial [Acidimicrobiales bacterium]
MPGLASLLAEACDGRFTEHHARLCRMLLDQADDLSERIETVTALLDEAIAALEAPPGEVLTAALDPSTGELLPAPAAYTSAIDRITALPGGGPETARAVIAEIGLDMAVFPSPQRLCSWAKTSPRTVQSGKKTKGAPVGKGNPYLKAALGQMATSAAKTDTFLGERYRRLVKRMPKAKALAALERSILVIIYH